MIYLPNLHTKVAYDDFRFCLHGHIVVNDSDETFIVAYSNNVYVLQNKLI